MNANPRHEKIIEILHQSSQPVTASVLAEKLLVSRQIIVGDIALLRAKGEAILATPKGYVFTSKMTENDTVFTIACKHNNKNAHEEIYTIVDNGGRLLDVIVEHPIYGQLIGQLNIASRYDADEFFKKVLKQNASLLSHLTDGVHLHTISCPNVQIFDRIKQALKQKGILFKNDL